MNDIPTIIDDVDAASASLSELGRSVVTPAADVVRSAIRDYAIRSGWNLVEHAKFADWIENRAPAEIPWLTLDPLIDTGRPPRAMPWRVSRVLHGDEWRVTIREGSAKALLKPGPLGLIDDAASSGSTLIHITELVERVGGVIVQVMLCAASAHARAAIEGRLPRITVEQFVPGGRRTIHLRDACPYLPFSGRPSSEHPAIAVPSGHVEILIPSITRKAGLWAAIFGDHRVLAATIQARSEVPVRFGDVLGRQATVSDIPMLGASIALPAYPRHVVAADTRLVDLC